MKKKHILLALCLACMVAQAQTLTIIHTSDTHSCIEPLSDNDPDPDAGTGGFMRRAALLRDLRIQAPDLLLLDCGDFCQGSAYYNIYKGEVEVALMNAMHYDVATIGNHEFDYGLDNMARIFRMASFPIVCCNYDFTATPCEGLVKPYVVLERQGLRIGVLGVGTPLDGMVSKANYGSTRYLDPQEVVPAIVDRLRNEEHCDVVICLTHIGYGDEPDNDPFFIAHTRGIDLVLGGHSHTYLENAVYLPNADGRLIPLDHQGKHGRYIGLIRMEF